MSALLRGSSLVLCGRSVHRERTTGQSLFPSRHDERRFEEDLQRISNVTAQRDRCPGPGILCHENVEEFEPSQ